MGRHTVIDWNAEPGASLGPGIVFWQARGEHAHVLRAVITPGIDLPAHEHDQEQMIVVLEGTVEIEIGDEVCALGPGQVICIPPHVVHKPRVVTAEPAVTLEIFSPPRSDLQHRAATLSQAG
jgi:quercetin dioxygenase-like cupin family protein